MPPHPVVVNHAPSLWHKVDALSYRPPVPSEGKVEPSFAEKELEEAVGDAVRIAKLELDPGLHLIVTLDREESTNLSDHDALRFRLVKDKMLCVLEDESYLLRKENKHHHSIETI
mgnify:FL=1